MERDAIVAIFDESRAASYDAQLNNIEAMHGGLMLGIRAALANTPPNARILCVGAGTGTEIVALARANPGWSFTAVEPAPAMMARCRAKLESAGLAARCTFVGGYLERLPAEPAFDAATCLLVSHFFPGTEDRVAFFRGIGARLKAGSALVTADLSLPFGVHGVEVVKDAWIELIRISGVAIDRAGYFDSIREKVGVLDPEQMAQVLLASGFESPAHIYRIMMLGGWVSYWPGHDTPEVTAR